MKTYFSDLEQPLIDILNKEYFFSKKLFIKTKNISGIEWDVHGDLSSRGSSASMSISYSDSIGFELEKLRLKSDGKILGQASYKLNDDFKLTACIEDGRVEPGKPLHSFGKLGFDSSIKESLMIQGDVDVVNGPTVQGSLLFKFMFLQLGGEFMCNTHLDSKHTKPELLDLNIGGAITGVDWFTSIRTTNLFSTVRVGYTCVLSKSLNFGALVNYRVFQNQQSLLFGVLWKPDENTEIRGRIDSAAVVGVSLHQKLTNYLKITLCSEVDTRDFGLDANKFGLGLFFE